MCGGGHDEEVEADVSRDTLYFYNDGRAVIGEKYGELWLSRMGIPHNTVETGYKDAFFPRGK